MVHGPQIRFQFDGSSKGFDRLLVQVLTVIRAAKCSVGRRGIRPQRHRPGQDCGCLGEPPDLGQRRTQCMVRLEMLVVRLDRRQQDRRRGRYLTGLQ